MPSAIEDMPGQVGPVVSGLTKFIESHSESGKDISAHYALALQVQYDLQHQHEWTSIQVHPCKSSDTKPLPRPLLSGVPAHHVYIHPDEQVEILKQGLTEKDVPVEREWVLPTHLKEKWTLRRFAEAFDAIEETPPGSNAPEDSPTREDRYQRKRKRGKRLLMAVVNDDSTIVYYIIHDGLVKPRQN